MKVVVICRWKHGFIHDFEIDMSNGKSGTNTHESIKTYLDGIHNVIEWMVTNQETGELIFRSEPKDGSEVLDESGANTRKKSRKATKKQKVSSDKSSNDLKTQAKELQNQGLNAPAIAEKLGKNPTTIRKWLKEG